MLIKPKCVGEVVISSKNCKQTAEKCKQIFKNGKNLPVLKHILALLTWGQKCTVSELQAFVIPKFQVKHPVELYVVVGRGFMGWASFYSNGVFDFCCF